MRRLLGVILLIAALFIFVETPPASACSCASSSTSEYLARADTVFSGTVVERQDPRFPSSSLDATLWVIEVDRVYKGTAAARQGVASAMSGASCGLEIQVRQRYVLFAHKERHPFEKELEGADLYAGLCDGTAQPSDELVSQLGPGVPPVAGTSALPSSSVPLLWAVAAAVALASTVSVTVRAAWKTRRS